MSGCAINVDATVNLVAQLATNFLNSCQSFTTNPVDQAACASAAAAVKAVAAEIVAAHDAWVSNPTATFLAKFKDAIAAGVAQFPAILAAMHVTNAGTLNIFTLAINLVLSTVQILAAAYGIASPAVTAHLKMAARGVKISSRNPFSNPTNNIQKLWNSGVCGGFTGASLSTCEVH